MQHEVTLIFPHQLFKEHPALQPLRNVILVEEALFFNQYKFHKQKLILHRASMQWYAAWLKQTGYNVSYIDATGELNNVIALIKWCADAGYTHIYIADVNDDWLRKRIEKACRQNTIQLSVLPTPMFINTMDEVAPFFLNRKTYFQTDFYIHQRKQRNILVSSDGMPLGGKWTFDAENRLRFPKKQQVPSLPAGPGNAFLTEAKNYTEQHYATNPGNANGPYLFSVTHEDAAKWLQVFIRERLERFGDYEDAIVATEHVLHHSVLTPMLNIGLLTPRQVLNEVILSAKKHETPINSLEGFVRQVMGWREFIRIVYEREGSRQRTKNYWQFKRKIPASFRNATTGIMPVDITIKKVLEKGYCHHIERLMVLGNFMLLCEFDPNEVYRWFMEMFIDAYDWVMVPNVYGMTQFADGGLMATKPYISGSNYLIKMSDYKKGEWQDTWDALFWRFMHVHRYFFEKNPRLGMLLTTFDKWPADKRNSILTEADNYLQTLDDAADNY